MSDTADSGMSKGLDIQDQIDDIFSQIQKIQKLNPPDLKFVNIDRNDSPCDCSVCRGAINTTKDKSAPVSKRNIVQENLIFAIKCDQCTQTFNDQTALWDHKLIYHEGAFNDAYTCHICQGEFEHENDLDNHIEMAHPDTDDSDDEITSEPQTISKPIKIGKYVCSICNEKFKSPVYLGEHFTEAHGSYEQISRLDKHNNDGFPGFDILEAIDMICLPSNREMRDILFKCAECPICQLRYNVPIKDVKSSKDRGYESDDTSNRRRERKPITFACNTAIDRDNSERLPYVMNCCRKMLCQECLKLHIMYSNSVKCLYCFADHTKGDNDYIRIYELGKTDTKSWLRWKKRHAYIYE